MKTLFRYNLFLVFAAGLTAAIYSIARLFLADGWQRDLLAFSMTVASSIGFVRWFLAVVQDDRDPLAVNENKEPSP